MQEFRYLFKINSVLVLVVSLLIFSVMPAASAAGYSPTPFDAPGELLHTSASNMQHGGKPSTSGNIGFIVSPTAGNLSHGWGKPTSNGNMEAFPSTPGNIPNRWGSPTSNSNLGPGWNTSSGNIETTGSNIVYFTYLPENQPAEDSAQTQQSEYSSYPCDTPGNLLPGSGAYNLPPEQPRGEAAPNPGGQTPEERRDDEEMQ